MSHPSSIRYFQRGARLRGADVARLLLVPALALGLACKSDSSTVPPPVIDIGQQVVSTGTSDMTLQGASGASADYVLLAYNSSAKADSFATGTITGSGLATAPAASTLAADLLYTRTPALASSGGGGDFVPDNAFHVRLQARARSAVLPRLAATRAWYTARQTPATRSAGGFNVAPSFSALPATVNVGDVVTLNVNADSGCSSPVYHGFRVKAVGTHSIVLADTLNPAGGFTDAQYTAIGTRFDNVVYPMDTQNFGNPTDIDNNGRIAILFTRTVNELTPANSPSYVGGFFYARDLLAQAGSPQTGSACPGSNEGEMFYMLVPDPNGVINGNVRRTGFVDSLTTGVLAHEFQHLINAGRRIYINTQAQDLEVVWLNEGLSHIAEELLYYTESGKSPRMNLGDADIRVNSPSTYPLWKEDASANFSRFIEYLQNPSNNSPAADNDSLATRGATWSFLRYAVDQKTTDEAATWRAFDNSVQTGIGTLTVALGTDPMPYFKSWALANYLDDSGFTTDPTFQHKSWNFRSIYNNTYINLGFPLLVTGLVDNTPTSVKVRGLSAAYYRLSVPAGASAHLSFSTTGTNGANLNFIAVRTR